MHILLFLLIITYLYHSYLYWLFSTALFYTASAMDRILPNTDRFKTTKNKQKSKRLYTDKVYCTHLYTKKIMTKQVSSLSHWLVQHPHKWLQSLVWLYGQAFDVKTVHHKCFNKLHSTKETFLNLYGLIKRHLNIYIYFKCCLFCFKIDSTSFFNLRISVADSRIFQLCQNKMLHSFWSNTSIIIWNIYLDNKIWWNIEQGHPVYISND